MERRQLTFEKVGNRLQLWNVVFTEAAVVDEQRKHVVELLARVTRVQLSELAKHGAPIETTNVADLRNDCA